jgi:DNA-binding MarR family transcriptional regulator
MKTEIDLALCSSCHCLAARRHSRALTRLYEAKLRPHGLRATQFSILVALALAGAKPISALAVALGLERTTLIRGAALLERNGWVEADRSESDRRSSLRLTRAGRRKLETAYPAWKEAQDLVEKKSHLPARR